MPVKTIDDINVKIKSGKAIVMTADEVCRAVRGGDSITTSDVDVVTSGTCGLMSGTAAVLSFPVAHQNVFRKAKMVWLNGIPALPGPAPNERLGIIDTIVYGTSCSVQDRNYGGGHLFREIVEGRNIDVEVRTRDGKLIRTIISLDDMIYARLLSIRNAFKNYMGFINVRKDSVKTIFHISRFKGPYKEFTFCGCGELNPLEKDTALRSIGIGTRCLINGALGYITGPGTKCSAERPNLSGFADMSSMKPKYMGGFLTSGGPEVIVSWAVPIPILDDSLLSDAKRTDELIPLPIADIHDRVPFCNQDYSKVWQGVDLNIRFNASSCRKNGRTCTRKNVACKVEVECPTQAFSRSNMKIDKSRCFNCGACTYLCPQGAFRGRLGSIRINGNDIPIRLRQSNRLRAMQIANELRDRIYDGSFMLNPPAEKMLFPISNRKK